MCHAALLGCRYALMRKLLFQLKGVCVLTAKSLAKAKAAAKQLGATAKRAAKRIAGAKQAAAAKQKK